MHRFGGIMCPSAGQQSHTMGAGPTAGSRSTQGHPWAADNFDICSAISLGSTWSIPHRPFPRSRLGRREKGQRFMWMHGGTCTPPVGTASDPSLGTALNSVPAILLMTVLGALDCTNSCWDYTTCPHRSTPACLPWEPPQLCIASRSPCHCRGKVSHQHFN